MLYIFSVELKCNLSSRVMILSGVNSKRRDIRADLTADTRPVKWRDEQPLEGDMAMLVNYARTLKV
jgi:hypothetical protein